MGRSAGDLGELARATRGFRGSRVDEAKTRVFRPRSATKPSGPETARLVGPVIAAVSSLAVAIAAGRQRARVDYHSSELTTSPPAIVINARRTLAGMLAFRNRTLPSTKHAFVTPA